MKAKLTFKHGIVFNVRPGRLLLPGVLVDSLDRRLQSMCFMAHEQAGDRDFLGDVQWLAAPHEHGLSVGTKFVMVNDPNSYVDGMMSGVFAEGIIVG